MRPALNKIEMLDKIIFRSSGHENKKNLDFDSTCTVIHNAECPTLLSLCATEKAIHEKCCKPSQIYKDCLAKRDKNRDKNRILESLDTILNSPRYNFNISMQLMRDFPNDNILICDILIQAKSRPSNFQSMMTSLEEIKTLLQAYMLHSTILFRDISLRKSITSLALENHPELRFNLTQLPQDTVAYYETLPENIIINVEAILDHIPCSLSIDNVFSTSGRLHDDNSWKQTVPIRAIIKIFGETGQMLQYNDFHVKFQLRGELLDGVGYEFLSEFT